VGGTISEVTGGKFANGARSAAIGQAFNGNSQVEREVKWSQLQAEFKSSIAEAYNLGKSLNPKVYMDKVTSFGDWDYKNRTEYRDLEGVEEFGNFAFGATSQAWADGFSRGASVYSPSLTTDLAMRGAGLFQQYFQSNNYRSSDGSWYDVDRTTGTNYGDNWRDQAHVSMGASYYYRNRGSN
jgi:hypothetical protein